MSSEKLNQFDHIHCSFHSEGSILTTVFGLLFWDILFAPVPGAFETAFQSAPLDLGEDSFALGQYRTPFLDGGAWRQPHPLLISDHTHVTLSSSRFIARAPLVAAHLGRIEAGEAPDILREVDERERDKETWCVGVRWYYERADLLEIVEVSIVILHWVVHCAALVAHRERSVDLYSALEVEAFPSFVACYVKNTDIEAGMLTISRSGLIRGRLAYLNLFSCSPYLFYQWSTRSDVSTPLFPRTSFVQVFRMYLFGRLRNLRFPPPLQTASGITSSKRLALVRSSPSLVLQSRQRNLSFVMILIPT